MSFNKKLAVCLDTLNITEEEFTKWVSIAKVEYDLINSVPDSKSPFQKKSRPDEKKAKFLGIQKETAKKLSSVDKRYSKEVDKIKKEMKNIKTG